jgi:3-phosphoshikimate 1-carboxyvinyltransferase
VSSSARAIQPRGPLNASVRVPGSKSLSNRALLLAGLARGQSELDGVLDSDDTQVMARALRALGAQIEIAGDRWSVRGVDGQPSPLSAPLDVHASGTAARFLTAVLALVPGESVLDGGARIRQRPIEPLCDSLRQLGVEIAAESPGGCPPVRCRGGAPFGGRAEVDARDSSQYVSALLQIGPYAARPLSLQLKDGMLASRPYVEVTLQAMRAFGAVCGVGSADGAREADAEKKQQEQLWVEPGGYQGRAYAIEPDASTAAYFFAAAAISGGRVRVEQLAGDSAQADMGFLSVLERMGCVVAREAHGIAVQAPSAGLQPFDVDMNAMPDAVLAAAVTALFAGGTSRIRNVAHLRIKESDRLTALETELRKVGATVQTDSASLTITPGALRGAEITTYDDHRMAMAFALAGLRVPGVRILDPECVSKSWPGYFAALDALVA